MYEQEKFLSSNSPNTTEKQLSELIYFYSWADSEGVDLDTNLLNGNGVSDKQVRQFVSWLRNHRTIKNNELITKSYNSILCQCAAFCLWCSKWEAGRPTGRNASIINKTADEQIVYRWHSKTLRDRSSKIAPDLTEEEIRQVEIKLKPENAVSEGKSTETAFRDYLIWHLSIEMGLRISEILALRLQDCPQLNRNHVSIVRIEERGPNYRDPRGTRAPRPKTLSRDLGFVIKNSTLPRIIQTYITKYRYQKLESGGKKFILNHDFLIIAHDSGSPLSTVSAGAIALDIKKRTGITSFHWHLCRHAFFNRAYAGVVGNDSHINDLVYYGGWSDASSLNFYIQRELRDRSINTLAVWQKSNVWEALNI